MMVKGLKAMAELKLTIRRNRATPRQLDRRPVIRVSAESYEMLIQMSNETGIAMSRIADKMLEFAAEHTEIVDD